MEKVKRTLMEKNVFERRAPSFFEQVDFLGNSRFRSNVQKHLVFETTFFFNYETKDWEPDDRNLVCNYGNVWVWKSRYPKTKKLLSYWGSNARKQRKGLFNFFQLNIKKQNLLLQSFMGGMFMTVGTEKKLWNGTKHITCIFWKIRSSTYLKWGSNEQFFVWVHFYQVKVFQLGPRWWKSSPWLRSKLT